MTTGFPEEHILSDLHTLPECHDELGLVCTDDTILIFTDWKQGLQRLAELENIFRHLGIPQRFDKDEAVQERYSYRLPSGQ